MNQETQNIKSIVKNITVRHIVDESPDLSYLGTFSDTQGEYAIHHNNERDTYKYFNAANVEDMTQAQQNYNRIMQFENGSVYMIGICADAKIHIPLDNKSFSIQTITSGGLWDIESDSSENYIKGIELDQIQEVKDYLKILNCDNIDIAPIVRS